MENLLKSFIDYAKKHGEYINEGNYKKANTVHSKLMKLYETIKQEHCWDLFEKCLDNDDDFVRLWAATFLLKNNEKQALLKLDVLKGAGGIASLSASTVIDMWSKGMLNL